MVSLSTMKQEARHQWLIVGNDRRGHGKLLERLSNHEQETRHQWLIVGNDRRGHGKLVELSMVSWRNDCFSPLRTGRRIPLRCSALETIGQLTLAGQKAFSVPANITRALPVVFPSFPLAMECIPCHQGAAN